MRNFRNGWAQALHFQNTSCDDSDTSCKVLRTGPWDSISGHCYSKEEAVLSINSITSLQSNGSQWGAPAAEGLFGNVWRHFLPSWLRTGSPVSLASSEEVEVRRAANPLQCTGQPPPYHYPNIKQVSCPKYLRASRLRNLAPEQRFSNLRVSQPPGAPAAPRAVGPTPEFGSAGLECISNQALGNADASGPVPTLWDTALAKRDEELTDKTKQKY